MDSVDRHLIQHVSVLSTGSVQIRPDHARRTARPVLVWLMTSRQWTAPLPINVYVVQTKYGLVLFDSGQDRASVTDPNYFPSGPARIIYDRLAKFAIDEGQTLPTLMGAADLDPATVTHVVLSHLHQDHIGGFTHFPNAEVLVSRTEWETAHSTGAELNGYLRGHIDRQATNWRLVDFAPTTDPELAPFGYSADVLGDRSLTLLPTPGHTPGSLSMFVRPVDQPPILLVGDLTYDACHFDHDHIPGIGNKQALETSTDKVKEFAAHHPGLVIAAAHDPSAAAQLDASNATR